MAPCSWQVPRFTYKISLGLCVWVGNFKAQWRAPSSCERGACKEDRRYLLGTRLPSQRVSLTSAPDQWPTWTCWHLTLACCNSRSCLSTLHSNVKLPVYTSRGHLAGTANQLHASDQGDPLQCSLTIAYMAKWKHQLGMAWDQDRDGLGMRWPGRVRWPGYKSMGMRQGWHGNETGVAWGWG